MLAVWSRGTIRKDGPRVPRTVYALAGCALAAAAISGGVALGAKGDLSYQGCFADTAAAGCSVPANAALGNARGVAVSPGGDSVYVASYTDDSISHFTRAASGTLAYQGCFADTAASGCSVPANAALDYAYGVVVSPGGDSVYVTSRDDSSISHFTRAANGSLAYQGCFADTAAAGCSVPVNAALNGASGVAVSPGGESIYVASYADDSISHFTRAANGTLAYQGCFADTALAGCAVPGNAALDVASDVAVSPGGDSVYVASYADDSISHFSRAPNGNLTYQGCFADTAAEGCAVPADAALEGALGVAVSPGGDSVYVASYADDSISHFSRAANGSLAYQGCFADTAAAGCSVPADPALDFATGVAVSPGSDSVYVASHNDSSISHFGRAPNGNLAYQGCFADTAAEGCAVPGNAALAGASGVVVSPGGDSVYVASHSDGSISHFRRELTPTPSCAGKPATKVGTSGKNTIVGTNGPDVIAGLGGNDTIRGRGGKDILCGGAGRDRLIGGAGRDKLFGQAGRDILRGGPAKDKLVGGPGRDLQIQ